MIKSLTRLQINHAMQSANKTFSCFIAILLVVALLVPTAGIPRYSFADEPTQGSTVSGSTISDSSNPTQEGGGAGGGVSEGNNPETSKDSENNLNSSQSGSSSNDRNTSLEEGASSDLATQLPQDQLQQNNGEGDTSLEVSPLLDRDIALTSINTNDPAQMQVLIDNRFTGLNPANTTVNLYDYTSYKDASGNDQQGSSALPANWLGTSANPNINTGHALTFGNGMNNDMGYWNAGSGSGMGVFSGYTPGFQNIVAPVLEEGYPVLSETSAEVHGKGTEYVTTNTGQGWETRPLNVWPLVGGYNSNPELYSSAKRYGNAQFPLASWAKPGDLLYPYSGGKNISDTVQNQWNKDRSLKYLFDTSSSASSAPGRTATHEDVKGLFQLDNQGYYYYNMRQNFAEYTATEVQGRDGSIIPANSFILYDAAAGIRTDGTNSVGNFFPFNTGAEVFKVEGDKLVNDVSANNGVLSNGVASPSDSNLAQGKPFMNHNLGMSMETDFRQPINGKVGTNDMTFEFIGDDDLWVFIDDVLVLDLGGVHSELYGTINFATGDVNMGTAYTANGDIANVPAPVRSTTIKDMFAAAGKDDSVRWNGNTFASSTSHTLKMFYFERGNFDSSLSVRFNLQPALYQQIKKVDQNGSALAGAEFDLYAVNVPEGTTVDNAQDVTLDQVSIKGDRLTHLVTDQNGIAKFVDLDASRADQDEPFNFSDRYDGGSEGLLYILRETKAPSGYKSVPTDLLIRFDPANTMLIVNNRYQSGAYASFNSYVTGNNGSIYFGQIGENGEAVSKIPEDQLGDAVTAQVPLDSQQYGLVVAVPMLKQEHYQSGRAWFPLYGDNLVGFQTVKVGDLNAPYEQYRQDTRVSTLTAALMQSAEHYRSIQGLDQNHTEGWYLTWDDESGRLDGTLQNLPGRADRYILTNPNGDMRMYYALIEPDALARVLGVDESRVRAMSSQERYEALGKVAMMAVNDDGGKPGSHIDELIKAIDPYSDNFQQRGYTGLDISEFIRNFRTVLYIPNEQRQLRVTKIDQNGIARNGAEFALYESEDDAKQDVHRSAVGTTATVDGSDGVLIFEPLQNNNVTDSGYANMIWPNVTYETGAATYYLKETNAPEGCDLNPTIIPIKVGVYSIYADAGTPDDGVSVSAGVGKLTQTMVQYASEGEVNITLRDITSFAQQQPSQSFGLQDWQDVYLSDTGQQDIPRSMNLHYGQNAVIDYGLSDADGGKNIQPFFVTDTGYMRARVQQNLHEHDDPNDPWHSEAMADDLKDMDITSLFSLVNTVIVTDHNTHAPAAGNLSISKMVTGSQVKDEQYSELFHFVLHIYDKDGNELPHTEQYYFYGKDRTGFIGSGDEIPLHHDEDIVVMGIPEGYTYKVTETDGDQNGLFVSPVGGTITGVIQQGVMHEAEFVNSQDKPVVPPTPDNPTDPGTPDDPVTTDDPTNPSLNDSERSAEQSSESGESAGTGDHAMLPILVLVLGIMVSGLSMMFVRRRH